MAKKKTLKLFVWENVFTDYTSGMACALAYTADEARDLIAEKAEKKNGLGSWIRNDLEKEPLVIESPEGFYVTGGG